MIQWARLVGRRPRIAKIRYRFNYDMRLWVAELKVLADIMSAPGCPYPAVLR